MAELPPGPGNGLGAARSSLRYVRLPARDLVIGRYPVRPASSASATSRPHRALAPARLGEVPRDEVVRKSITPTPIVDRSTRPIEEMSGAELGRRSRLLSTIRLTFRLVFELIRHLLKRDLNAQTKAVLYRQYIERMGGLWIKMGQLLALRPDILSEELCSELSKLHDRAAAYPFEILRPSLEQALGRPLLEVFAEIEEKPIAAASIGQVHRAVLRRNRKVVVIKVQKPDARSLFMKDLRLITIWVRILQVLRINPQMRWSHFLSELRTIIAAELDYRMEMGNIELVRKSIGAHTTHRVIVPRGYERYSNAHMLTMDYLDGVFMSDVIEVIRNSPDRFREWCAENNISPRRVAERLLLSVMRQIFEDDVFHGDLHPGNIVLFRDSKVGLIDFGSVGMLDRDFTIRYRTYLEALARGEYSKAADYMLVFFPHPPTRGRENVREALATIMREWQAKTHLRSLPYHERSLTAISNDVSRVSLRYRLEPNWTLLRLGRTWATLDASLYYLRPNLNYFKVVRTYSREAHGRLIRSLPATVAQMPELLNEVSRLLGPYMRNAALELRARADKGIQIAELLLRTARVGVIVGVLFALWLYAARYYQDSFPYKVAHPLIHLLFGHILDPIQRAVAHLSESSWITIIVVLLALVFLLRRAIRILGDRDRQS